MSDDTVKLARTMAVAMDKTFHESTAANSWRAVANALEAAYARIEEQDAALGMAKKALEPFAKYAEFGDDAPMLKNNYVMEVPMIDLRYARDVFFSISAANERDK